MILFSAFFLGRPPVISPRGPPPCECGPSVQIIVGFPPKIMNSPIQFPCKWEIIGNIKHANSLEMSSMPCVPHFSSGEIVRTPNIRCHFLQADCRQSVNSVQVVHTTCRRLTGSSYRLQVGPQVAHTHIRRDNSMFGLTFA